MRNKQNMIALAVGVLIGVIGFGLYKFTTYDSDHTHYHSNFALYVDGEKEQFEHFGNYEELSSCSLDSTPTSRGRAHMHEPENSVVHIHDEAVTWGSFFENLGISVGQKHLSTETETYVDDDANSIQYILNGEKVNSNLASREISNEDRLLVVVGQSSEQEALALFESEVPVTAAEFNESSDPGVCGSNQNHPLSDRFKEIF